MSKIFKRSAETDRLVSFLSQMSIGQSASFAELSAAAQTKIVSTTASYQSARHIALKKHGVVTGAVRGVGVQRLSGMETVDKADQHMACIRRRARHGQAEVAVAMRTNLTTEAMIDATRKQAAFGLLIQTATAPKTNRAQYGDTPPPPPRASFDASA